MEGRKEGSSHPSWQHRLQRYILEIIPATIYGLVRIRLWLPSWRSATKPSSTKGFMGLYNPAPCSLRRQPSFARIWTACKIIDAGYAMFHVLQLCKWNTNDLSLSLSRLLVIESWIRCTINKSWKRAGGRMEGRKERRRTDYYLNSSAKGTNLSVLILSAISPWF